MNLNNLTNEEKMLVTALLAKVRGKPVEWFTCNGDWVVSETNNIDIHCEYRIKQIQPTPLVIPDELWKYIKGDWVAMDEDKKIHSYNFKPNVIDDVNEWYMKGNSIYYSLSGLNINTDNVDWKTSLVQRPEYLK